MKKRLVAGFGGACAICGRVDHEVVYDFHHKNPKEKDFILTGKIRPWKKIMEEAVKCAMLCSPCHRKLHIGLAVLPEDAALFKEALLDGTELAFKEGPSFDKCPVCDSLKNVIRKTCSPKCAGSLRITGKKPKNLLPLLEQVKARGYLAVAKEIGVTDNTLRKWLRAADIPLPRFRYRPSLVQQ